MEAQRPERSIEDTGDVRICRRDVKLTNLDKVFFPALGRTKGDLIEYYVDVADRVLHHVRRRPMHMALRFA
jgi:bifunctional non-homologous end joining protein LigD